ncbi:MAG: hypothetical protein NTX48_11205 [Planctomycetales bacterium]|nr:hypothetical protein [Planctomycetales bacterium]
MVARIAERTGRLAGHLTYCPRRQLFSFVERAFNTREAQDGYTFVVFDAVSNADLLRIELKNEIPTGISISTSGEEVAFVSNRISDVTRDLRGTIIENAKPDMTKGLVESKDEIGILRLCKLEQGANASEVALRGMRLDCVLYSEDNHDIFVGSTESGKPDLRDLYGLGVSVPVWTPKLTLLVLESSDGSLRQKIDLPLPTLREGRVDGVPRVKDMDLSRDGSLLAVGFGRDNRGGKWGRVSLIATRTLLPSTPTDMSESEAASFVMMSDSDFCVAGGPFGQLFVWKVGRPR